MENDAVRSDAEVQALEMTTAVLPADTLARGLEEPPDGENEIKAMLWSYRALKGLDREELTRVFDWLAKKLDMEVPVPFASGSGDTPQIPDKRSDQKPASDNGQLNTSRASLAQPLADGLTPQAFMAQKKPVSMMERIACLAFYLTHYRGTDRFKPADLDAVNVEAKQPRIGNPRASVDNAIYKMQFLAVAPNGEKSLTTRGEAVVAALPDREKVEAVLAEHPMAGIRRGKGKKNSKAGKE
ncbi:MAG: hypothetical protein ACJ796_00795 [Gemmatimonadaceae bacterium]